MRVKIYKPSRTAMQSGRAKISHWVIEYETESARRPEALMGWTASADTLNQVQMKFQTSDDAVAFAEKNGWDYTVYPDRQRRVKPRNFGDNFKYIPPETQEST